MPANRPTNNATSTINHRPGPLKCCEKPPSNIAEKTTQLSAQGQKLEEVVHCLIRWGMQFPQDRDKNFQRRREWDILPLRAYFNPGAARQWSGSYQLELDGETFHLAAIGNQLRELANSNEKPVARLSLSGDLAIAISNGEISLRQALKDKQIPYSGRRRDVEAFFAAFSA
jgi:hypothetical protein